MGVWGNMLGDFWRDRSGAAMVEFAVTVPIMLLIFAFIMEGTRMLWTHQVLVSGVRDAARYAARVAPRDICTAGGNINTAVGNLNNIVTQSTSNASVLPGSVTVTGVTAALTCFAGGFRIPQVGVVNVTATLTINHPLGGAFGAFGGTLQPLTYTVTDSARIHGE